MRRQVLGVAVLACLWLAFFPTGTSAAATILRFYPGARDKTKMITLEGPPEMVNATPNPFGCFYATTQPPYSPTPHLRSCPKVISSPTRLTGLLYSSLLPDVFVSTAGDDDTGDGTEAAPYKSIYTATVLAPAGSVVRFFPGTYVVNASYVLTKSLSFESYDYNNRAVIETDKEVFTIEAPNLPVKFSYLNFTVQASAALWTNPNSQALLELDNTNWVLSGEGCIGHFLDAALVQITNLRLTGEVDTSQRNLIFRYSLVVIDNLLVEDFVSSQMNQSGVLYAFYSDIQMTNSAFRNVSAYQSVIYFSLLLSAQVDNFTMSGCNTHHTGFLITRSVGVVITNSLFENNIAFSSAPVFQLERSNVSMSGLTIRANSISDTTSVLTCSSLASLSSNVRIEDSLFEANGIMDNIGGSILALYFYDGLYGELIVYNCTFRSHYTQVPVQIQGVGKVHLKDCYFYNNTVTSNVVGYQNDILVPDPEFLIENLVMYNNTYIRNFSSCGLTLATTSATVRNVTLERKNLGLGFYDWDLVVQSSHVVFENQASLGFLFVQMGAKVEFTNNIDIDYLFYGALSGPFDNDLVLNGVNLTLKEHSLFTYAHVYDPTGPNSWIINDKAFELCCGFIAVREVKLTNVSVENRYYLGWGNRDVSLTNGHLINQPNGYVEVPYFTPTVTITADRIVNFGEFYVAQATLTGNFEGKAGGKLSSYWSNHFPNEYLNVLGTATFESNSTFNTDFTALRDFEEAIYLESFDLVKCGGGCSFGSYTTSSSSLDGYDLPEAFTTANGLSVLVNHFNPHSVRLDATGSKIVLAFPIDTDMGSDGQCDQLIPASEMHYYDADTLTCLWTDAKTLEVSSAKLPPRGMHSFRMLNGQIVAAANASFTAAPIWTWLNSPLKPVRPTAKIIAPPTIPICGDVVFDGGSSTGAGSYPMRYKWQINFTTGYESTELSGLASATTSSLLVLPAELLEFNVSYSIKLTVTNNFTYQSIAWVSVTRAQSRMPALTLDGLSSRTQLAELPSQVKAKVSLAPCLLEDGIRVILQWTQTSGTAVPLLGGNTTILYLPAGTLTPGASYGFRLDGFIEGSPTEASSVSVLITTPASPRLKALVAGDGTQSVSTPVDIALSIVDPYDDTPLSSGVNFTWTLTSCPGALQFTQLSSTDNNALVGSVEFAVSIDSGGANVSMVLDLTPTLRSDYECLYADASYGEGFNLGLANFTANRLSVPAGVLEPGKYTFIVTATTGAFPNVRSASALVSLTLRPAEDSFPSVRVTLPKPVKVLATDKITLGGEINGQTVVPPSHPSLNFDFVWEITGLDLDNTEIVATHKRSLPLILKAGVLTPGRTYRVTLSAWYLSSPTIVSTHTVLLAVNTIPAGGSLSISPAQGVAGQTRFSLAATNWNDPDQPLRYEFALVVNEVEHPLDPRSETAQLTNVTLNAWSTTNTPWATYVLVRVFDIWGGFSTAYAEISLTAPATSDYSLAAAANYAIASDETQFDRVISGLANFVSARPEASQAERIDMINLVLEQAEHSLLTTDKVNRLLGMVFALNQNGQYLVSDESSGLLDSLSIKSLQLLEKILNSALTSLGSDSTISSQTALFYLDVLGSIAKNQNANSASSLSSAVTDLIVQYLHTLTQRQVAGTLLHEAPSVVASTSRSNPLSLVASKDAINTLDGTQIQVTTQYAQGSVELPTGFGANVQSQLLKRKRALQDQVTSQFVQWSSGSFPHSAKIPAQTQLHSTVLSFSIFDSAGDKVTVSGLTTPVKISFLSIAGTNITCAWWAAATSSWETSGCDTEESEGVVNCHCSHLTDFGVIFAISPPTDPPSLGGPDSAVHGTDPGVIAAVVVVVLAAAIGAAIGGVLVWRRRRAMSAARDHADHVVQMALHTGTTHSRTEPVATTTETLRETWKTGAKPEDIRNTAPE